MGRRRRGGQGLSNRVKGVRMRELPLEDVVGTVSICHGYERWNA